MRKILLSSPYLILFGAAAVLFLFSTGFVFADSAALHSISKSMFRTVCHQFEWRSWQIDGIQMAVCTRCFGIYSGAFMATVILPFVNAGFINDFNRTLFGASVFILLNVTDFAGNLLGFWSNTLYSRYLLGLLAGIGVAWIIVTAIKNQIKEK